MQLVKDEQTNRMFFFFLSLKIRVKSKHLSEGGTSMQLENSHASCSGILQPLICSQILARLLRFHMKSRNRQKPWLNICARL